MEENCLDGRNLGLYSLFKNAVRVCLVSCHGVADVCRGRFCCSAVFFFFPVLCIKGIYEENKFHGWELPCIFKYTWHCPKEQIKSLDLLSASRYSSPFLPMVFKHKHATSDFAPFLANFCVANSQILSPFTTIRFSLNKVSNDSSRQHLPGPSRFFVLAVFSLFLNCRSRASGVQSMLFCCSLCV